MTVAAASWIAGLASTSNAAKLAGDLSPSGLAVTPIPDVAGSVVQLMNAVGSTVEGHQGASYGRSRMATKASVRTPRLSA
jgi:hypothetical protein